MEQVRRQQSQASPFHAGEQAMQERLGVREKVERFGRKVIRDHLIEQHREFYAKLPFLLLGSRDETGQPWASILAGRPGFAQSPDPSRLRLDAAAIPGDPLEQALRPGAQIGGLGIEFATRRRNRFSARVGALDEGSIELLIDQAFGNCPQYIQTRQPEFRRDPRDASFRPVREELTQLDEDAQRLIAAADTFFIASAAPPADEAAEEDPALHGVDVSHRGGKPGFVRIDDEGTLTVPDFAGNLQFNTLGNLMLDPRAGLLFADFDSGDLLFLAGEVEIIFESEEIAAFRGAERLWRFRLNRAIRVRQGLPMTFRFGEYSPNSLIQGDWQEAAGRLEAERQRNSYRPYRIARVVQESSLIRSFYLEPADDGGLPGFEAGQFLPIKLDRPESDGPLTRTYTVSSAPEDAFFRISVKRETRGEVSRLLHDRLKEGDVIEALAPRGQFTIDAAERRPVVMIAGGIGVTPMVSMLRHLLTEGLRTRHLRPVWFLYSARTAAERAFFEELQQLAAAAPQVHARFILTAPSASSEEGRDYHAAGRLTVETLKALLPFDDYDFYVCGPAAMIQQIYEGLRDLNVADGRIHAEAFGPAGLKRRRDKGAAPRVVQGAVEAEGAASVAFAEAEVSADWTPEKGTLLELAEDAGLSPVYGCRSGSCGSCAVTLLEGDVRYVQKPSFPVADGEVLTCCAVPDAKDGEAPTTLRLAL